MFSLKKILPELSSKAVEQAGDHLAVIFFLATILTVKFIVIQKLERTPRPELVVWCSTNTLLVLMTAWVVLEQGLFKWGHQLAVFFVISVLVDGLTFMIVNREALVSWAGAVAVNLASCAWLLFVDIRAVARVCSDVMEKILMPF